MLGRLNEVGWLVVERGRAMLVLVRLLILERMLARALLMLALLVLALLLPDHLVPILLVLDQLLVNHPALSQLLRIQRPASLQVSALLPPPPPAPPAAQAKCTARLPHQLTFQPA
jgi:hypothetical protein